MTLIVSSNEDDRTMNPEHLNRMVLILHHLEPDS